MTLNPADAHDTIRVRGARVNNLKNVDVDVPKRRLNVFTGVSGSGKSSLVFGTIAAESRRLIDETYSTFIQGFMPSLPRPEVDVLENLSPAIIIDQERMGANSRSTVGTATDAHAILRLLFSRLSEPHVGTSSAFSFNLPDGWCPTCEGSGQAATLDESKIIDESKSLNAGAITAPGHNVGEWYWKTYGETGLFDLDKPINKFSKQDRDMLMYAEPQKIKVNGKNTSYEGLITRVRRLWIDRAEPPKAKQIVNFVADIATTSTCPDCQGSRLKEAARIATVNGKTIGELATWQVDELLTFVQGLDPKVGPARDNLLGILQSMVDIGLGYLSLDRAAGTLSGGEAQRVKMIRHLGSPLSDVTYVFDEPTTGLHPHDIQRMVTLLQNIRDKGNTVLVVEHKPEVIKAADNIIDIGPGSGKDGGELVYSGPLEGLAETDSITAKYLNTKLTLREARTPPGVLKVEHVNRNNVRDVTVEFPLGVLTAVTGVAGSGKSSLVSAALSERDDVLVVDQSAIRGSRRSNPATYTGILDKIRAKFAKDNGVKSALFSSNSEGACETCKGLGVVYVDLSFTSGVSTTCEECQGKRFKEDVLQYKVNGLDISEVLDLSVRQALEVFKTGEIAKVLKRLVSVGLPYLKLGQPLSTLSGGERQRLKLAAQMTENAPIIVLDEPTSGLHLADTKTLIEMMHSLVDQGRTVIAIEHNVAVMAAADHIIDVGPEAGHGGGQIVFAGTPEDMTKAQTTTAEYLRKALA
ncbi:ATP-binding cassette domain-containing protein [Corynebacterium epidermidicanis]|uniref:UvrABC system protein A n=1 Tax=Corynebacterium epidermidicanis TaxID=1050174 RepID=A0A0G3GM08_9CORY|nr:excinuclease ABC subunit UvrA [Corynebacterium epidermidicanis]AKK02236.1 Excinuclease ATPase subunit [Corynebacterium epidermidicanis]